MYKKLIPLFIALLSTTGAIGFSESKPVRIGIATILSGDLAVVGDNIQKTVKTYKSINPSSRLEFIFEDARLSSTDGLKAYQKLISADKVDIAIAACTSNGTMSAISIFNSTKTPVISVSTGGSNIDNSSEYLFRIGNSDSLNGINQADYFIKQGIFKVAVLTEQTEYTEDITKFFLPRFKEIGGSVVYSDEFLPGTVDFKSIAAKIKRSNPQAIFIPTQTGSALGIFLKQWGEISPQSQTQIHTTFVAAPNVDAHRIAGPLIKGVYYMEPTYSENNERRKHLFEEYRQLFGSDPSIPFHTAGLVDSLDLLSKYLESHERFNEKTFREFLLSIKDYDGMLGNLTFDEKGNTAIGFRIAKITSNLEEKR